MSYKTKNGYNFFECSSAFQKAIRRGEEEEAVFWAIELYLSGQAAYVWKRLLVMAHEDIGLAEPDFTPRLLAWKKAYDYFEQSMPKRKTKNLPFLQAVIGAVHAKKSRYMDIVQYVYFHQHEVEKGNRPIPEYAHDMHTYKGKAMKHGIDQFYDDGAKTNNNNFMPGEEDMVERARVVGRQIERKEIDIDFGQPPDGKKRVDDMSQQVIFTREDME